MDYVMVSRPIFNDLMSAKSKITDIEAYAQEYALQLDNMNALKPLNEILRSKRYMAEEVELGGMD